MSKVNVRREELNKNFPRKEQHKKFLLFKIETIVETEIPVTKADTQEKKIVGEVWKLNWGQKLEVLHDQLKNLDFLFYTIY